jgi:hypothetical protein
MNSSVGLSLGGHIVLQALPDLVGCIGVFAMTMPITKPIEPQLMYQPDSLIEKVYQSNPLPSDVTHYASRLLRPGTAEVPDFLIRDFNRTDPTIHSGIIEGIIDGR